MTKSFASEVYNNQTMDRLHHTYAGYLRLMQMSATQIFVFVEGIQCDSFFFSSICDATLDKGIRYEVSTARQIPGGSGGKQALLGFFAYLRQRKALVSVLGSQKTTCIFFLDKDIDDIHHSKKRSPHVVYTQHYDVQNYVFQHADLVKGTAAAASVDPGRIKNDLADASRWCRYATSLWRDWIALCLRLVEDRIPCEANFRVSSRVQSRLCGPTDQSMLDDFIRTVAQRVGVSETEFKRKLAASTARVDGYLARGEHHKIFKGKWFAAILADDVDRIMAGDPYHSNGLSGRLPCTLAATLDFSNAWAEPFKQSLRDIAAML